MGRCYYIGVVIAKGKRLKNWKKKTLKKFKKNVDKAKMTMYNNRALTEKENAVEAH